jgi:hypothetical protein
MGEPYEVQIKTTADPSGAEETKAALASVGDEAAAIDQRQTGFDAQKQEIAVAQLKALQAEALGQEEVAAALQREVSLRSLALRLQQESNISEAEAVAIAEARSIEDDKIYGKAGKFKLLQNLGVDSNTAKTLGIAALAGFQLSSYIEDAAKYYDDLRITAEKESAELAKQVESWRAMAASAKDLNDVATLQESIVKNVNEQLDKIRQLPSEGTKGFFTNAADAAIIYENALRKLVGRTDLLKTSTDEDIKSVEDHAEALRAAGAVMEKLAKQNEEFAQSVASRPLDQQVDAFIQRLSGLQRQQESVNRATVDGERSYQRLQLQIDGTSKSIIDLAQKEQQHEADIEKRIQLERDLTAAIGDPAKFSAAQHELESFDLGLRIRQQIKNATDAARLAGIAWSGDEAKAVQAEIEGPLTRKLKLLQEARDLASGPQQVQIQKQIDALTGTPKDNGLIDFLRGVTAEAGYSETAIENAKSQLDALDAKAKQLALDQKLAEANAIHTPEGPPIPDGRGSQLEGQLNALDQKSKSLETGLDALATKSTQAIGDSAVKVQDVKDEQGAQAEKLSNIIKSALDDLPQQFTPISQAIQTDIPKAIEAGTDQMVKAVASSVGALTASFTRRADDIDEQIAALWRAV